MKPRYPGWRFSPETGEGRIFQSEDEVPKGWTDNLAEALASAKLYAEETEPVEKPKRTYRRKVK